MFEFSQAVSRILALFTTTALFAGIWANDQPPVSLTEVTPVAAVISTQDPLQAATATEPEWVAVTAEQSIAPASASAPEPAAAGLQIHAGGKSKTFSVEAADLLISERVLQSHLDQLPVGMPSGDYRIVDSLGGVGWLRVRVAGGEESGRVSSTILSTTVDDDQVRFIRVAVATVTAGPSSVD